MRKKPLIMFVGVIVSAAIAYQQAGVANAKSYRKEKRQNDEYRQALKILWTSVYASRGKTLYCDMPFSTKNRKERKKHVNAEHVFPMSWVAKDLKCGTRKQCQARSSQFRKIESDLHNIYPARIDVNKARSNYRFGSVSGEERAFGACDFEVNKRRRVAEPRPVVRGEVARSMLYLADQYGLSLHRKTEKLMLQWDRQDPPSDEERRREKIIHQQQGRENLFISQHPYTGK